MLNCADFQTTVSTIEKLIRDMVFSSIVFLFYFLPAFLIFYYSGLNKTAVLLLFSLVFYAYGEVLYTYVLLVSIVVNYLFGVMISKSEGSRRRAYLALGVTFNLLLLFWFKYANFAYLVIADISSLGLNLSGPSIHLPLGISFFTFHALSYIIDVYRRTSPVERSIVHLGVYISMFPQLVAGPIIRFHNIQDELHGRYASVGLVAKGIVIFSVGLAQKVLLANVFALPADQIFALSPENLRSSVAWLGIISYTLQIYFDFLGYSTMAIGLALMIGFHFPENFNYPYISQSITEFWRRWHITLSSWFRDYLYIPLGGNRAGPWKTYRNLIVVFFLCGLWHGASWTFVIWGLFHGVFLVVERAGLLGVLDRVPRLLRHTYALLVVCVGWVFFRADSLAQAIAYLRSMFGLNEVWVGAPQLGQFATPELVVTLVFGIIFSTPALPALLNRLKAIAWYTRSQTVIAINDAMLLAVTGILLSASAIRIAAGTYNPFIYFRF